MKRMATKIRKELTDCILHQDLVFVAGRNGCCAHEILVKKIFNVSLLLSKFYIPLYTDSLHFNQTLSLR